MGVTSPDNIYVHDGTGPASITQVSQSEGASVQAALLKRMRFDFVWDDAADRTAQTGMVQGSRGYQIDIKSEYLYDNSAWRLAIPHAEFTASKSIPNAVSTLIGVFSNDASASTDTTFVTPGTDGILTIANPGVYAVTGLGDSVNSMSATSTLAIHETVGDALVASTTVPSGQDKFWTTAPNLRVTVSNFQISFKIFQSSGSASTVATRARITRLG